MASVTFSNKGKKTCHFINWLQLVALSASADKGSHYQQLPFNFSTKIFEFQPLPMVDAHHHWPPYKHIGSIGFNVKTQQNGRFFFKISLTPKSSPSMLLFSPRARKNKCYPNWSSLQMFYKVRFNNFKVWAKFLTSISIHSVHRLLQYSISVV